MKPLKIIFYLLFLFSFSLHYSQAKVHHWMMGAQGKSSTLSNGVTVYQSVGQQTVTNTGSAKDFVQQGFQQSYWKNIISKNNSKNIVTQLFPNPFVDFLTITFSSSPGKIITCEIYDLQGRLVFNEKIENTNNQIKLNLKKLINTQFLLRILGDKLVYSHMIIKK